MKTETIILSGGHSIILGHKPKQLSVTQIQDRFEGDDSIEISRFGLFDSSSPNYTTYYPDVKPEDLRPSDDEFIEPVFRMLSNVTVNKRYNPIHFTEDVLKKNMYKLVGQTVNVDHEMAVGNAIGTVKSVEWQNSYTLNGVKVPAGINAVLKIDGKSNPRLARGILMDPPAIHSNSVTVTFSWVKSHPEMGDDEFMNQLGKRDSEGKLIQKVVNEIIAFHETSLVSHGADPFAQIIRKNGKINNPLYASSHHQLNDDTLDEVSKQQSAYAFIDWKQFTADTGEENTILEELNNDQLKQNQKKMEKFFQELEKLFGLEANSLNEDNYLTVLSGEKTTLSTHKPVVILGLEGHEAIEGEITSLRGQVEKFKDLPEDFQDKLTLVDTANKVLLDLRTEVKSLYNLTLTGSKPDEGILKVIEEASYDSLKSLHKQYDKLSEEKFGFTCKSCGSHEVTRATARGAEEHDDFVEKSDEEIIGEFTGVQERKSPFLE